MQRVKLILSDIDGTIMPMGQQVVPDRVLKAFHVALDAGIAIGPATGRSYAQLPRFFQGDAACCATAVTTNGLEAYVGGQCVQRTVLPREALLATLDFVHDVPDAGLVCFDGTTPLICDGEVEDLLVCAHDYGLTCKPHAGVPEFPVVKANVFVNRDRAATVEFADALNEAIEGLDFDVPSVGFLNIMPSGWNKGSAITYLCEHMGIGLDEVVVFGDAGNDLTMFETVPNSVAVENAMEVAAKAARWHIGSCDDFAVAHAVEALAAGSWPFVE